MKKAKYGIFKIRELTGKMMEARTIIFIGSSLKDLKKLPLDVQDTFNFGLVQASDGKKHVNAKPLKGFGGNSVLEIVQDHRSGTYRAVYTVRFKKALYVLHVFQKKSKRKIATPKEDIELVEQRLKRADGDYQERFGGD